MKFKMEDVVVDIHIMIKVNEGDYISVSYEDYKKLPFMVVNGNGKGVVVDKTMAIFNGTLDKRYLPSVSFGHVSRPIVIEDVNGELFAVDAWTSLKKKRITFICDSV